MITFADVIERKETITVDGYSSAKTLKGAIKDFGRYIKKHYSESEGSVLTDYPDESVVDPTEDADYFFQAEGVPCATRLIEETEEMEYKEGYNYYLVIRFYK